MPYTMASAHGPALPRFALRVLVLALVALPAKADGSIPAKRWVHLGTLSAEPAEWVATDGRRVAFGTARRVVVRQDGGPQLRLLLEDPVADGVLAGDDLYVVRGGNRLARIDLDAARPQLRDVPLTPEPRGRLHLALVGGLLAVSEDARGLRLVDPGDRRAADHQGPHEASQALEEQAIPLNASFTAVAAAGSSVFLALEGGQLLSVDLLERPHPTPRTVSKDHDGVLDVAVGGSGLWVLSDEGVQMVPLKGGDPSTFPQLRGASIAVEGRKLYIAAGDAGLLALRDAAQGPQLHMVSVGNNFFSPAELQVDVGDSVRWNNLSGFHNVFSCNPTELGCDGAEANETFISGPPAPPIWTYTYTFMEAGTNPYVCQAHPFEMTGAVTVGQVPVAPPEVPDGSDSGTPLLVDRLDPLGETLAVSWDSTTCPGAVEHNLLYSLGSFLSPDAGGIYRLRGSRCALGGSPFVWTDVPDPAADDSRYLWWLVVSTDGVAIEGPWGTDGDDAERTGPGFGGSSGECGINAKNPSNLCP